MDEYIGLDVSERDGGINSARRQACLARQVCFGSTGARDIAPQACAGGKRVVFETGPLSVWFFHALTAEGMPAICIEAPHANAALDMAANETDANDADGLAHLAEVGFYREVRAERFAANAAHRAPLIDVSRRTQHRGSGRGCSRRSPRKFSTRRR